VRSSGIEREARGSSECRGDELIPRLRQTFAEAGSAGCLCLKRLRKKSTFARNQLQQGLESVCENSVLSPKGRLN
jgi:hypothetical protein